MEKIGLIVEGGGIRAMYAAGVLDVFLEAGLSFDGVIGVSAGAIHSCSFLSGQKGRSIRFYRRFLKDPRFFSFRNFLLTGDLVDPQFCYYDLPERLDPYDNEAFRRNPCAFHVTVSNVRTGRAEYPRITDLTTQMELLRASATLPYVSHKVRTEGKLLLDGGCLDPVPIRAFESMGYTRNVIILTKAQGSHGKDWDAAAAPVFFRHYPRFIAGFRRSIREYPRTLDFIAQREKEGNAFVIRPSRTPAAGRLSKSVEELNETYELGRTDALGILVNLRKWLEGARNAA